MTGAKEIFQQALERPLDERAAFVETACGGDASLEARVARLLRAHEEAGSFLGGDAIRPGARIGPYQILEEIGAGGFGTVYRARQSEPVRREVALKVVKPGMDTREILARFEAERQALALMNHPGIAQVHDAGTTEHGRPYFVMELVPGVPVTRFADEASLDAAGRLRLFRQVCLAIQHAHHKGIVHRDIKPSNVLVTRREGGPAVKVIDFGVAKAIGPRLTEETLVTRADLMVGTPEYMSPEQAEMPARDVDTRSDVYSLGVLLYELLTGTTPFDARAGGYLEVMRAIREDDPPRPSTRISTLGARLAGVARSRRSTPRGLGRLVRGDLDWIVMKALEKDRDRRYETADALARDVDRFLRDEPVEAGPPSASYRLRKFVRRHRAGVAAAGVAGIALLAGLAVASYGLVEARAQRDLARDKEAAARTEALRARTVLDFVEDAFATLDPHNPQGAGYTVHRLLLAFERDLDRSLADEPEVEATVRSLMGRGFLTLGLPGEAERHIGRAVELCRKLHGEEDRRTLDALTLLGSLQHDRGDFRGALETHLHVLALRRKVAPDDTLNIASALNVIADLHRHLGDLEAAVETGEQALALYRARGGGTRGAPKLLPSIYRAAGRHDDAVALYRELLDTHRSELGDGHPRTALYLGGLAKHHRDHGDLAEAESLAREELAIVRKFAGPDSVPAAASLAGLAGILVRAGKHEEAEPVVAEAIAAARAAGIRDWTMRDVLLAAGELYSATGRPAEAIRSFEECIAIGTQLHGADSHQVAQARVKLAMDLSRTGNHAAAEEHLRAGIRVLADALGENHHDTLHPQITLGRVLCRTRRHAEAEPMLRRVVAALREHHPGDRGGLAGALNALTTALVGMRGPVLDVAREAYEVAAEAWGEDRALAQRYTYGTVLVAEGEYAEGERILRGAYEAEARLAGPGHDRALRALKALAYCLDRQGRHAEAAQLWGELVDRRRERGDARGLADALQFRGLCLATMERHEEAAAAFAELLAIRERALPEGHWLRHDAMSLLGACLTKSGKFERAEALLLEAQRMEPPPTAAHARAQARDRLVELYRAWGKPDKAEEWGAKK